MVFIGEKSRTMSNVLAGLLYRPTLFPSNNYSSTLLLMDQCCTLYHSSSFRTSVFTLTSKYLPSFFKDGLLGGPLQPAVSQEGIPTLFFWKYLKLVLSLIQITLFIFLLFIFSYSSNLLYLFALWSYFLLFHYRLCGLTFPCKSHLSCLIILSWVGKWKPMSQFLTWWNDVYVYVEGGGYILKQKLGCCILSWKTHLVHIIRKFCPSRNLSVSLIKAMLFL